MRLEKRHDGVGREAQSLLRDEHRNVLGELALQLWLPHLVLDISVFYGSEYSQYIEGRGRGYSLYSPSQLIACNQSANMTNQACATNHSLYARLRSVKPHMN